MITTDLTPMNDQPTDTTTPFVQVYADKANGRAVIALDTAAIDALIHYLDDIGPLHDLTMNPGNYGVDDDTAQRVADVLYRITGPLNKVLGYR